MLTRGLKLFFTALILVSFSHGEETTIKKIAQLQHAENPPMQVITREPPPAPEPTEKFEISSGDKQK